MLGLDELVHAFAETGLDFVIIGGIAAVTHGSARFTHDVDIMIAFTPPNMDRLRRSLAAFDPTFRGKNVSLLSRSPEELARYKNIYLRTSICDLDILATCPVGDFATVGGRADVLEIFGQRVKVMNLDDLIESKEILGREKDRAVVRELRAIREALHDDAPPCE